MLVSNTADAQMSAINQAEYSPSQVNGLITGKANGVSEAGLAYALENDPNLFSTSENLASDQLASKPPGEVVAFNAEMAQEALIYAEFSDFAYDKPDAPAPDSYQGFNRVSADNLDSTMKDDATGFAAEVYVNDETNEVIIAFRGSDDPNDWSNSNLPQAFQGVPESYLQALDLTREVAEKYSDKDIHLTGHSLGGGLANFAAIDGNHDYTVFNAAGLSKHSVEYLGDSVGAFTGSGTVINNEYDPLTNFGGKDNDETWGTDAKHIGYDEIAFIENNDFNWWDIFNPGKRVEAHSIDRMISDLKAAA